MDAFLRDFDQRLSERFIGLRHDSGDPYFLRVKKPLRTQVNL